MKIEHYSHVDIWLLTFYADCESRLSHKHTKGHTPTNTVTHII